MAQEPGVIAPKRCAECGGVMVFGELDSRVQWRIYAPRSGYAPVKHKVKRYDMPDIQFPVVVNVCTVCGHIALYAAYPTPDGQ